MLIDCASCVMRDIACSDCVVTALLGPMPASLNDHKDVLEVMAGAGLIAPLRLIRSEITDDCNSAVVEKRIAH